MSGFLTGIVAIVDSEGNRIDTPNVDGDHAPVELQLGAGLTGTKSTNGWLTRVKVDGGAGGGVQVLLITPTGETTNVDLPEDPSEGQAIFYVYAEPGSFRFRADPDINGDSGHYFSPSGSSMVLAVFDGDGWQARGLGEPPAPPPAQEPAIAWSPPNDLVYFYADPPTDESADKTTGCSFFVNSSGGGCFVTGIQFYWAGTANETVKTVLYSAAGAVLATANVVTAGANNYESAFDDSPVLNVNTSYTAAVYDVAGGKYTKVANDSARSLLTPARPFFAGRRIGWVNLGLTSAGDAAPTSTSPTEFYLVAPILQE